MAVRLVFLGRLEDFAGAAEREAPPGSLADIVATFAPALARAVNGERIRLAVNGALVPGRDGLMLADGDELAFLPPVSGG